jgi:acyl-coenzyme A thioesterase PaaI-like protein
MLRFMAPAKNDDAMPDTIPTGFELIVSTEGFIALNGPYYWRQNADGRLEFGFQTDARHANPNGFLHGGAVLGFLDTILGHAIVHGTGKRCATIALDSRFIAAIGPGPWVSGRTTIKKLTRSLAFIDAEALADDVLLVTANAVFRIFNEN